MKVLTGRSEELKQSVRDAGHEVLDAQAGRGLEHILSLVPEADAALSVNLPREAMLRAPRLRAIVTTSIGLERIDVAAATELGILVCNSPSQENYTGVAEATIGLLVALSKRLKRKEASLRHQGWGSDADRGILLSGRTLGLVGFGRTAQAVARRLAGWDMRILAHARHIPADVPEGVEMAGLEDLFRESDFVSVHLVLTPETRGLIGESLLRLMKPGAYIVNTSRGAVFDEPALVRALVEGSIAGAALDVFESEPLPPDSPLRLLEADRVILTPHNVTHTWESQAGGRRLGLESTLAVLRGEIPDTVVNREAIPSWLRRFGTGVK